jgi:hypothetical protein
MPWYKKGVVGFDVVVSALARLFEVARDIDYAHWIDPFLLHNTKPWVGVFGCLVCARELK